MNMYYPIKFDCKQISNPVDMTQTVIFDRMSPHCGRDPEDSKPTFLHGILAHDDASPYQVWLQKAQHVKEILSRSTFTGFFTNFSCDLELDHKKAIQSFHKTTQFMIMCHQTKFSCKMIISSQDILESLILII